jgi:hypothetical protein
MKLLGSKTTRTIIGSELRTIVKTSDYTMTNSDFAVYADATNGAVRITLPLAAMNGNMIFIQKIDGSDNPVFVKCLQGEAIGDKISLQATKPWEGWTLVADGVRTWNVISISECVQPKNQAKEQSASGIGLKEYKRPVRVLRVPP